MRKKIMFGSMAVAVLLLGVGCGGGSSSSSEESTSSTVTKNKTGYYIDSAVVGVKYQCVAQGSNSSDSNVATEDETNTTTQSDSNVATEDETNATTHSDSNVTTEKLTQNNQKSISGTTSENGAFSYQEGQVCTFSVGGVVLRTVDTSTMEGDIVFEDNIHTAQFLQTLDNDDNPQNGIQITTEVAEAIASREIVANKKIPQTEEELTEIVAQLQEKVETYKGQMRTQEEARSHLEDTRLNIEAMGGRMNFSIEENQSTDEESQSTPRDNAGSQTPMARTRENVENNTTRDNAGSQTPMARIRENVENNTTDTQGGASAEAQTEGTPLSGSASTQNEAHITSPRVNFR
jgi:hypothetical protein